MITVVIAIHDGEKTLPLTMEALCLVRFPKENVEIIAVDNASDDNTAAILKDYEGRLPMTVLTEPRPGKSFALNLAIQHAQGELVVFTDDDVIPSPGWLEAYARAAREHPEVGLFAGQVRHFWQKTPPRWLEELAAEGKSYGGTPIDRPEGPAELSLFKGANFMVRRKLLDTVQFCEDGNMNFAGTLTSAGGEDTKLIHDLAQRGAKSWFVTDAHLQHIVRPYQVGIWPVLQRYYRIGRATVTVGVHEFPENIPTLFGYPRYLFKTIPSAITRCIALFILGRTYQAMNKMISVSMSCGQAVEWRHKNESPMGNIRR